MFWGRYLLVGALVMQACATASSRLEIKPNWLEVRDSFQSSSSSRMVWIIEEWEIPVKLNTHENPSPFYPQNPGQRAIYEQVSSWASNGQLRTLYGANCHGELGSNTKLAFNGWTYNDLESRSRLGEYSEILTYAPLKVKARFPERVDVFCLESESEIQEFEENYDRLRAILKNRADFLALDSAQLKGKNEKALLDSKKQSFMIHLQLSYSDQKIDNWSALGRFLNQEFASQWESFRSVSDQRAVRIAESLSNRNEPFAVLVVGTTYVAPLLEHLKTKGVSYKLLSPKNLDRAASNRLDVLRALGGLPSISNQKAQ